MAAATPAQQPIVYPSKGQSAQQQAQDTTECQTWAKQTTGVDPVALAQQMANQHAALALSKGCPVVRRNSLQRRYLRRSLNDGVLCETMPASEPSTKPQQINIRSPLKLYTVLDGDQGNR